MQLQVFQGILFSGYGIMIPFLGTALGSAFAISFKFCGWSYGVCSSGGVDTRNVRRKTF